MVSPILFASSRSPCIMLQKVSSVSNHDYGGISNKGNTDTLRIVQTYVKECLDIFVNDAAKHSDLHICRLPMLSFISNLCSKKVRC